MVQFLRIEGVNFRAFLDDTLDLSIIRGGGLLLLRASELAREVIEGQGVPVTVVNSGASVGIFSFEATADATEAIRLKIEENLAADLYLRHATFVVDTAPQDPGFAQTRAQLMAKNRWRQMQTLSLVYPSLEPALIDKQRVCEADHLRPAARQLRHWDILERKPVIEALSQSSFQRHEYGRDQRVRFYQNEAVIPNGIFADDLNEIAGDANEYGSLDRKVAVIHLDGNKFGSLFADHCQTPELQAAASEKLRSHQRTFLQDLFQAIHIHPHGWYLRRARENGQEVDALRLETLIWGGDELRFVVPAWKAVYFLDLFFRAAQSWQLFGGGIPVTHSAGLVFCNCKCNIHSAAALAKELCETAKEIYREDHGNDADLLVYQVLESFDHIGQGVNRSYMTGHFPFLGENALPIALRAANLRYIWMEAAILRDAIPRRRLHEVVHHLMAKRLDPAQRVIEDTCRELSESLPRLRRLSSLLGGADEFNPAAWFHLNELWDYVGFEAWQFPAPASGNAQ